MLDVRECRFAEIADSTSFSGLCEEYASECAIEGLPAPMPHVDTYMTLDQFDRMKFIAAFDDGQLVGFIAVLVYLNPHYSATLGVVESYFVAKAYRGSGAGMKLLRYAEAFAKDTGAAGLIVCAPVDSLLAAVLDAHKSYLPTNRVFMRSLT